jgi:hypothetical protein
VEAESSYTATATKKPDRDRDIVRELQEDAKWSMWTNTFGRQRGWGRPRSLPHGVGLRTYMLAAIIILGTVIGVIGLIALLLNLDLQPTRLHVMCVRVGVLACLPSPSEVRLRTFGAPRQAGTSARSARACKVASECQDSPPPRRPDHLRPRSRAHANEEVER